jgi:hypothetical protein
MSEETTGSASQSGNTAQATNTNLADMSSMKDELAKVVNRLKEQESFINRQANEIGELRKLAGKAEGKATAEPEVKKVDKVEEVLPTEKPFDFFNLTPTEQDAVTVYMREHLKALPAEEKVIAKETLKDTKAFNALAKDICDKLRTPKYLESILGEDPVQKKPEVKSEVLSEIRAMLKLVDAEKNAMPPSGGSSRGTVIPQKQETPKRKFANGGIMSLTQP